VRVYGVTSIVVLFGVCLLAEGARRIGEGFGSSTPTWIIVLEGIGFVVGFEGCLLLTS
jgi:hypothetical protein